MQTYNRKLGVMDTGIATENTGDLIIMEGAKREIENIFTNYQLLYFPTHEKMSFHSLKLQKLVEANIACGTNLLHSHMSVVKQWNIGAIDAFAVSPVILLGVGWRSHKKRRTDPYTRWLLRKVLSSDHLHSVRDSYTESRLREIGISHVINTGCPTTWTLTPRLCSEVPTQKGENAVVLLSDYSRNKSDISMLNFVCSNYRKVYFWCQGTHDNEYLESLGFASKVVHVPPSLAAYRQLLSDKSLSLDYIGTRLHGGVYALQHKRRTIIIGVDHRAMEMGKDLNLPVVDRYAPEGVLEETILEEFETRINLPVENIRKWTSQFDR